MDQERILAAVFTEANDLQVGTIFLLDHDAIT
jgi:hypothetical protein